MTMQRPRWREIGLGLAMLIAGLGPACAADPIQIGQKPQPFDDRFAPAGPGFKVSTWITRLDSPWSLVFLPNGRALVSERGGAIRVIEKDKLLPDPLIVRKVATGGEGGLMGLALHPRFPGVPFLYAMETIEERGRRENRVVRFPFERANALQLDRIIVRGIPAAQNHNGGRHPVGAGGRAVVTPRGKFPRAPAQ